ncbi:alpha/beta fold hydrolase [Streptosporangium sp. NPDC048047]|uniref:alpha/beta fold hydrolase n=1 Tax=Streptosporangium sp. NPDC048047 TaxID=3155748 RepID=UPI00341FA0D5
MNQTTAQPAAQTTAQPTAQPTAPVRAGFRIDGRRLSYVDFGGPGRPLIALHGHMSEGASFAEVAAALAPEWRVIAPDQRGHGESDRASDYSREGYVADVVALLDHLGLDRAVLLGHSLGGINAYQLAARHPERVSAFVNVDAPVRLGLDGGPDPLAFVLSLPYEAPTRETMIEGMGHFAPFFADALRENPDGSWRLPFHPEDIHASEQANRGDHWADWTASTCPALVIRATRGGVISAGDARAMVERRPGTRLVELETDHFVYAADPGGVASAVAEFLRSAALIG